MRNIEIYTRPACGYCSHAKRYLDRRGLPYREYDISRQPQYLKTLQARTDQRSFPQIFVDGHSIGGFEDLLKRQDL